MKKIIILFVLVISVAYTSVAQQSLIKVNRVNGATDPYPMSLVDSIVFSDFLQPSMDVYLKDRLDAISFPNTDIFNFNFSIDSGAASCGVPVVHNQAQSYGSMTDQQGNVYRTIVIGTQEWMAENLNTGIYRNGNPIDEVTGNASWQALSTGAWAYYNNDALRACPYGKLYNWFAVADPRNLCPSGWHLPSDAEWSTLIGYLDPAHDPTAVLDTQSTIAGGALKSEGQLYWGYPNTNAINNSGFSALPGGFRNVNGPFVTLSSSGWWWSATASDADNAFARQLVASGGNVNRITADMNRGYAIRCVKAPAGLGSINTLDCGNATNNGTLTAGTAANGVSSTLAYTGGNGGTHSGQTVNSTGVTGLTATLAAGSVANGSGTLTWTITGTPNAAGTASFALNIAGQGCTLNLTINAGGGIVSNPGAGVAFNGYTYPSIVLGNGQEWMAENLRTTTYANGDPIPNITDNAQWSALTTGAWSYYDNNSQFQNPYGKLYNWYAVNDSRNVCPAGWHVPTNQEWTVLSNYLGGSLVAGGKLKSVGTLFWSSPNQDATNEIGFSGLPGGGKIGVSINMGSNGYYWTSTEIGSTTANSKYLSSANGELSGYGDDKWIGFSVRCLKD